MKQKYFANVSGSNYFADSHTRTVTRQSDTGQFTTVSSTGPRGDRAYSKSTARSVVKKYALKRD